jgi:hypothetical protein
MAEEWFPLPRPDEANQPASENSDAARHAETQNIIFN